MTRARILLIAALLFTASTSFAGTGTGCSGDQWDDYHEQQGFDGVHFVYRTRDFWQIGNPGDAARGCGPVSARDPSKAGVTMHNKLCAFTYDAASARLSVTSMPGRTCGCTGTFTLHQTCVEGQL